MRIPAVYCVAGCLAALAFAAPGAAAQDEDAPVDYGVAPGSLMGFRDLLRGAASIFGQRNLAERIGLSRATLSKHMNGKPARLSNVLIAKTLRAIDKLNIEYDARIQRSL